jgi:hypothetical protein
MDTASAIILIGLCIVALGFSACAFAYKYMALSAAAGFLWLIIGLNRIIAAESDFDAPIGLFCLLLAIVMFLSIAFLRQRPPVTVEPDNYTAMAERIERLRGTTERFKARGKDVIL